MSRHPRRFAIAAILVGILGLLGLLRFSVDSGQSLLVGSNSAAGQTYTSFAKSFGSDPIVVVFSARNPTAPYLESNLLRLGALESDLAGDPRVASVLGPGTAAFSLQQAAGSEVNNVLVEYPYFVAETDYIAQVQAGNTDQNALSQRLQTVITDARAVLELYVVKAASDAHNARAAYTQQAGDQVIDSREKAVDAAVSQDPLPPLFAEYLAGPGQPTDTTEARAFFDRVTAAIGDCDDQLAQALKITRSCQVFFERSLLDLPNCPKSGTGEFCAPKSQWAGVLPVPVGGNCAPPYPAQATCSNQVITIRLKPEYVDGQTVAAKGCNNPCNVGTLVDKINGELAHGIANDFYTRSLPSSSLKSLQTLGPLHPTECGVASVQQDAACNSLFQNKRLPYTTAGAPLLAQGVVRSMTQLLAILFPVALVVMLVILVTLFRVRGRAWPLLAAGAASVLTVGVSLLTGTPITPAVLAGVPVLVGLAVDYSVQFVARFDQERARTDDTEAALRTVLQSAGRATMIAGIATIAGLLALALVSGIDGGPLVAVPLVAEFALVLVGGVILAWLAGLFIALPLAVWSNQAGGPRASVKEPNVATPARTIAIADNWRGVTALAAVLGLGGWIALHFVPVQTDVQQLVSSSLPELQNVQTVQAETGYTNEVDVFAQGQVAGPYNQAGTPQNVQWQCQVAAELRKAHASTVATATSIADFFIASASGTATTSSQLCVQASPSPSPSPSPSASPRPSATPTPSPSATPAAASAARGTARLAATTPTPSASPSASSSPSASATPVPSSSSSPSAPKQQTRFLCELRLFPLLSRVLVGPIGPDTQACPPVDEFQQRFITSDTTPIDPNAARIALGVRATSVSEEAQLVDDIAKEVASPPNGMVARPSGLAVLATTAYDNLVNRAYLLNLVPLAAVALALWASFREPRRAFLPLVPAVLAAGWAPLVLLLLGRLPGATGATLGSLNPLTVVLGGLVIALGTEFGVMLLSRFYEARRNGLDPDAAAGVAIAGVGRPIAISAATLGAGFAVLAISGLFPDSFPLVAAFGLDVVIDLGLAVGAVFLVMLPLAVALERTNPLPKAALAVETIPAAASVAPSVATAAPFRAERPAAPAAKPRARRPTAKRALPEQTDGTDVAPRTAGESPAEEEAQKEPAASSASEAAAQPRRRPGVSGRRRATTAEGEGAQGGEQADDGTRRRPGVSGRRRGNRRPGGR